jgi:hypothetical protein
VSCGENVTAFPWATAGSSSIVSAQFRSPPHEASSSAANASDASRPKAFSSDCSGREPGYSGRESG